MRKSFKKIPFKRYVGIISLLMVLMAAAITVEAATYYVSPTGIKSGNGSREKPFSIGHVLQAVKLEPGDEVVFLDGLYELAKIGGGLSIRSTGTEHKPVIYRAENRHKAILDGGVLLSGWKKAISDKPIWECLVDKAPSSDRLLVDGEGLLKTDSPWRRDGKTALEEGMFAVESIKEGGAMIRMWPWGGREPKEAYSVIENLVDIGGSFNIVDGLLLRRGINGVGIGGRQVHVYRLDKGDYFDISGLGNNLFGSFNILRNCIVLDILHRVWRAVNAALI